MCSFCALCMMSCAETDDSSKEFDNWQARNDSYFESIYQQAEDSIKAGSKHWLLLKTFSLQGDKHTNYVVVNIKKQRTPHEETREYGPTPYYTDTVRVHYRGNLMPSDSHPQGYEFDSSWAGEYNERLMTPQKFSLLGTVDGFSTAIQNMHVGDRWIVYIPYALGYKDVSSNAKIPAYSTLVFDIALHSFSRPGQPMPNFQ